MVNPFPELLVFGFFAPTILRVAVAGFFFYAALMQIKDREKLYGFPFPALGKGQAGVSFSIVFDIVIGILLLVGYQTQIAAIAGIVAAAAAAFFIPRYLELLGLSRNTIILLCIILLSLLISGAGAMAYDLPL